MRRRARPRSAPAWGSPLAWAVLAAMLAASRPGGVAAQELGRLFSTPEQRRVLDEAREDYDPSRREVIVREAPEAAPEPPPPPLPDLAVDGVVIRSDGPAATWINGAEMLSGESTVEGIRVEAERDGAGVRFVLPDGSDSAPIKPGQALDPNVGAVRERFRAEPGAAAPAAD